MGGRGGEGGPGGRSGRGGEGGGGGKGRAGPARHRPRERRVRARNSRQRARPPGGATQRGARGQPRPPSRPDDSCARSGGRPRVPRAGRSGRPAPDCPGPPGTDTPLPPRRSLPASPAPAGTIHCRLPRLQQKEPRTAAPRRNPHPPGAYFSSPSPVRAPPQCPSAGTPGLAPRPPRLPPGPAQTRGARRPGTRRPLPLVHRNGQKPPDDHFYAPARFSDGHRQETGAAGVTVIRTPRGTHVRHSCRVLLGIFTVRLCLPEPPDESPRHIFWMTQELLLHGCGFNEPTGVHCKSLTSLTAASAPGSSRVSTLSHSRQKPWPQHNVAAVSS